MDIKIGRGHILGIFLGLVIIVLSMIYLNGTVLMLPVIIIGILVSLSPFWIDFLVTNRRQKSIEEAFPDFIRNVVSAAKSGMPISKAIVHVSTSDYSTLTPYVRKLAHQIEWNIPLHRALINFGKATNNKLISRSMATVIEVERSGGSIEDVLGSVTESLLDIRRMKEKLRTAVHSSVVQSYVIFFVFLATMIVVQNLIIPYMSGPTIGVNIGGLNVVQGDSLTTGQVSLDFSSLHGIISSIISWASSLRGILLVLAVIQGFFSGIVLGKMAEGNFRAGLVHSVSMMVLALIVILTAQGFL